MYPFSLPRERPFLGTLAFLIARSQTINTVSSYLPFLGLGLTLLFFIGRALRFTTLVFLEDDFGCLVRRTFAVVFSLTYLRRFTERHLGLFHRRVAKVGTVDIIYFSLSGRVPWYRDTILQSTGEVNNTYIMNLFLKLQTADIFGFTRDFYTLCSQSVFTTSALSWYVAKT